MRHSSAQDNIMPEKVEKVKYKKIPIKTIG